MPRVQETARELFIRKSRGIEFESDMQTDFFEEDEYGPCLPTREADHLVPILPGVTEIEGELEEPEPHYETVFSAAESSTIPLESKVYRGFETLPDLETDAGRRIFYAGEDRGVASEEDALRYRPCSSEFIDSLFVDYLDSFVEKTLASDKKIREKGRSVHKSTEREFDRLQNSRELFKSEADLIAFRKRLVDVFVNQTEAEQTLPAALQVLRSDTDDEWTIGEFDARPSLRPLLPAWTQFLGNQSPGVPQHMATLYEPGSGHRDQVLPPSALAIREHWMSKSEHFQNLFNVTPDVNPRSEWYMARFRSGNIQNNDTFAPFDDLEPNNDSPSSLPAVNKQAMSCLTGQPLEPETELDQIDFEVSYRYSHSWGCMGEPFIPTDNQ